MSLTGLAALGAGCVTPSSAAMAEQHAIAARMGAAAAVHLPKEVDSCVGVTLRLGDPAGSAESLAERALYADRVSEAEVSAALGAAGGDACRALVLEAYARQEVLPEPLALDLDFGVDAAGRVCAVVERTRMEPRSPGAAPVLEAAAGCLKDALLGARLPAGRVEGRARIVRSLRFAVAPGAAGP